MLSVLCLILVSVYLYRHHLYNKLDRQKLSHSSYYDVSFGGERKCSDEVVRILKDVGGYKKIVVNWHYCENGEPSCADVILLHETGIYVVEAEGLPGLDFRGAGGRILGADSLREPVDFLQKLLL